MLDRFVQQALLQILQRRWDPTFSDHSFGFRPGRSAHQAVARAQQYVHEGLHVVVDIDLEKFFDQVNHDKLMGQVAKRIADTRARRLIRAFLNAGVMEKGLLNPTEQGTPQGGPLSPLLSNLVLDELDKELERRGHRFCRYADDCNVYVRTQRAGERVMASLQGFITRKLKLRVNEAKSAVGPVWERQFLGFSFVQGKRLRRSISADAVRRFRSRVRRGTRRTSGMALEDMVKNLAPYLRGWRGYFGQSETPSLLRKLDAWIRRRLRSVVWKRWKTPKRRCEELRRRGVRGQLAPHMAASGHGPWHLARTRAMHLAMPNAYFDSLGLPRLAPR